jgi:hypothetical protein
MAMVKGGDRKKIRVQDRMWIKPTIEVEYHDTVLSYQRALRVRAAEAARWTFHNGGRTPGADDLGPIPWPTPAVARNIVNRGKPKTSEEIWLKNQQRKCEEKVERTGVVGVNSRYGLWEARIYISDCKQDKKLFPTKLEAARWRNKRVDELFPERPWMKCDIKRLEAEERGETLEDYID